MTTSAIKRGVGALLLLVAAAGAAQSPEKLRNHFDSDGLLREPAFFDFQVLGPALGEAGWAEWKVLGGFNPPSAPNHVSQVMPRRPADSIAAAFRRNSAFRDGAWTVSLQTTPRGAKGTTGRGGILFRMAGEGDFLVLLVDLATGEARLSSWRKGKATELGKGTGKITNEWSVLKITATGPRITAEWDGKPLLQATDPSPETGKSAMATAGPGVVSFDEFLLDPAGN